MCIPKNGQLNHYVQTDPPNWIDGQLNHYVKTDPNQEPNLVDGFDRVHGDDVNDLRELKAQWLQVCGLPQEQAERGGYEDIVTDAMMDVEAYELRKTRYSHISVIHYLECLITVRDYYHDLAKNCDDEDGKDGYFILRNEYQKKINALLIGWVE